ncbi:MAG: hypothetical protein H6835_03380 [Planctomycetes bacterium]|nr:hypothetical protein [Planctomycetota bacterium]
MKTPGLLSYALAALAAVLLALLLAARPGQDPTPPKAPTFATLDVLVDAGDHQLAAWQLDVTLATALLVGIEGGTDAAFRDAPRYDPAALQGGRVVLAALADAQQQLPNGRVLVARLHVMAPDGAVDHTVRGVVAASADGQRFTADVEVRLHENK